MESFLGLFDPNDGDHCSNHPGIGDFNDNCLPPEPQVGNIEYKLKIVNPSKQRFEHLVTQLKWRLREGQGEAIYEIGVEDNGVVTGLTPKDIDASLRTLDQMASRLGASITILREKEVNNGLRVAEVLVRKIPRDRTNIEIRIAVVGNADGGKSTLLGVLTQGSLDNGRGSARLNMFRHLHEIQTGRTSSISHEILGFKPNGELINYSYTKLMTAEEICDISSKLITFMDLAGHKKFLRTTIKGLSGYSPHYAMLVISSIAGIIGMTQEHLSIAVTLKVPFFIVVTKIDLFPPGRIMDKLNLLLKQVGSFRVPLVVNDVDDVMTASTNQLKGNIVPIFCLSSVTGHGIDLLLKFLQVLPPGVSVLEKERLLNEPLEFQIDEIIRIPDIGLIVGGLLSKGIVMQGSKVKIGPHKDGSFTSCIVKSIQRNRVPCRIVYAGQSAALCLDNLIPDIRNGMVLLNPQDTTKPCLYFQANITVLFHDSAIRKGNQFVVHIANVRQAATVIGIFKGRIFMNESGPIVLKFSRVPEFIRVGQNLLFTGSHMKGIGEITQIFALNS